MPNSLRLILSSICLLVIAYFSLQIIVQSKERKILVFENAEAHNIKYGLLSVHAWKKQVSDIINKKIQEFELTESNRAELRQNIQKVLRQILAEVEEMLDQKQSEGNILEQLFTGAFQEFVLNTGELERKIPEFTEIILKELDNPESREKMRAFIQKKLNQLLAQTAGEEDLSKIEAIAQKYACADIKSCGELLEIKLTEIDKKLQLESWAIVGLSVLIFCIILIGNKNLAKSEYIVLIVLCGMLLLGGVLTPMLDIDARIEHFQFNLMGESLEFNNQILFFQSKSIFEVVQILFSASSYQSMFVGFLIFLFSIIFPISKLVSSFLLIQNKKLYQNKIIHFLALKSGKWSMADVLVVAIFMSYIAFSGVLESQLKQLERVNGKVEMLTTDHSNFGVGFILFLSFCIGGLILASLIDKKLAK
jgi:hypothetical protein